MADWNAEIAGPGRHDGMRLTLPKDVVAIAVYTRDPEGRLSSCLCRQRGAGVDLDELAVATLDLAMGVPESAGDGRA